MGWLWSSKQQPVARPTTDDADSVRRRDQDEQSSNPPSQTRRPQPSSSPPADLSTIPSLLHDSSEAEQRQRLRPSDIYPKSASCTALFDQAFYCQTFGGQFLSIYRYGHTQSCSQHWSNFWWCVQNNRNAMLSDEERENRVMQHYWEQDQRVRKQPHGCSEDVWRQRKWKIDRGIFVTGERPLFPEGSGPMTAPPPLPPKENQV